MKTAIFLGGMECDTYVSLFLKANGTTSFPKSTREVVNAILRENNAFILPEMVKGSGQFPDSRAGVWENGEFIALSEIQSGKRLPELFRNEEKFFAVLDLSLAIQTETALLRAGLKDGTKIFTEGGFRKNELYNEIIASALPKNEVYLTNIKEATAFGAAMSAAMVLEGKKASELAPRINIEYKRVEPFELDRYEEYKKHFFALSKK